MLLSLEPEVELRELSFDVPHQVAMLDEELGMRVVTFEPALARMQQAADPGSILLAAPAHALVEGYFRVRPLGALQVRGSGEPVEAFVLDGEGTVTSRLQASLRRGVSPFRGREAELGLLGGAWERAVTGPAEAGPARAGGGSAQALNLRM